jgi:catechol 2,3-dioxygenase-like lactoylglutathione lyase family enzyme
MQITLTSILVDDQARALAFYTDVLGFQRSTTSRWASTAG